MVDQERLEGYVVDIACLRKYPEEDVARLAREHTRGCCLHGHCIESGYGLVTDDGRVLLLDAHATPLVVERLVRMGPDEGIRLRAERGKEEGEMRTRRVEQVGEPVRRQAAER